MKNDPFLDSEICDAAKLFRLWKSHHLKGPFCNPQPHPLIFSKNKTKKQTNKQTNKKQKNSWDFYASRILQVYYVCVEFIADFVWWSNHQICANQMPTSRNFNMLCYVAVWHNKLCITHRCKIRIDWNFRSLFLSTKTVS